MSKTLESQPRVLAANDWNGRNVAGPLSEPNPKDRTFGIRRGPAENGMAASKCAMRRSRHSLSIDARALPDPGLNCSRGMCVERPRALAEG